MTGAAMASSASLSAAAHEGTRGHFEKAGVPPRRPREVFCDSATRRPGDKSSANIFSEKESVDVVGVSKGRLQASSSATTSRRVATHGSMFHRAPGFHRPVGVPVPVFPAPARRADGGSKTTMKKLVVVRVDARTICVYLRAPSGRPGTPS